LCTGVADMYTFNRVLSMIKLRNKRVFFGFGFDDI